MFAKPPTNAGKPRHPRPSRPKRPQTRLTDSTQPAEPAGYTPSLMIQTQRLARARAPRRDLGALTIRPVLRTDLLPLASTVGEVVDSLYPDGWRHLRDKLETSLTGKPSAFVIARAAEQSSPLALAAEVDKGLHRRKLSTFWVAPDVRQLGLGTRLLDCRVSSWLHESLDSVTLTVRNERAFQLLPLLTSRGFRVIALDIDRYGPGADELVLEWRPAWLAQVGFDVDTLVNAPQSGK